MVKLHFIFILVPYDDEKVMAFKSCVISGKCTQHVFYVLDTKVF